MTLNGLHDSQANSPTSPAGTSYNHILHPNAPKQPSSRSPHSSLPGTPTINNLSDILEPPPGVTFLELIKTWTDSDVARWLFENKVGHLANVFRANDIRSDVILDLNQEFLKEMGIKSVGERIRVLNAVKILRQRNSLYQMSKSPATDDSSNSRNNSPTQRAATNGRRLESARPAPLQLVSDSGREGLPRLVRDGSDSARTDTSKQESGRVRPLPFPNRQNGTPPTNTPTPTASVRHNLPPLPPPPRGQPPLPPTTQSSNRLRSGSGGGNLPRKTPNDLNFLPNQSQSGLLTPSAGQWGLPSDPRPSGRTPVKGGSALTTGVGARSPPPPYNHGRNTSLSNLNPNVVPQVKVPPRPSTSDSTSRSTSYPNRGQSGGDHQNLSPINEYLPHYSGSGNPPPQSGYRVGPGPYQRSITPSTSALDKRLVKFQLPEAGQSVVIDAGDCAGGVEILEKAIKKLKVTQRIPESDYNEHLVEIGTGDGGLSVEGWGVFADWNNDSGRECTF